MVVAVSASVVVQHGLVRGDAKPQTRLAVGTQIRTFLVLKKLGLECTQKRSLIILAYTYT
jgi:hypothetical protein